MALKEFDEFLEEPLVLPIGGKKYVVPPVDAISGIRLSETFYAARTGKENTDVDDDTELDIYKQALGTAYDELVADKVPFPALVRAGKTAMYDFLAGRSTAEKFWNTGALGEPVATQEVAPAKKTSKRTGAASKTPSRASTTGTKSRPKSSNNKPTTK
ncbi:hypothetical protein SAMN06309944_0254 [Micrococcales bacterium KH10]|nr:hypothetical protein SAMN06309944_0254 [Micrococcales bacterium KH10]